MILESGEMSKQVISWLWALYVLMHAFWRRSHILTFVSTAPDTTTLLSCPTYKAEQLVKCPVNFDIAKEWILVILPLTLTLVSVRIPVDYRTTVCSQQYIPTLRPMKLRHRNFCIQVSKRLNWLSIFKIKDLCWRLVGSTRDFEEVRTQCCNIDLAIRMKLR